MDYNLCKNMNTGKGIIYVIYQMMKQTYLDFRKYAFNLNRLYVREGTVQ